MDIELRRKMFEMSGQQYIKIDEDSVFEKPIKINGYEANNMAALHELMACDVITSEKYNELVGLLEMGEIGVLKKRKKYKELYEDEKKTSSFLRQAYQEVCVALNEIDDYLSKNYSNPDYNEIQKIIDKVRY